MSDKDKDIVLNICRRIERVLQRDWGSTGAGLRERLGSTRYVVPPELRKRIRYLHSMHKQALKQERFKLKSAADFEDKGEQILDQLAEARKTAPRRLRLWLKDLVVRYRILFGTAVVALLVAVVGLAYLLFEPEPSPAPVATVVPKPAPKPVPRPAPKPAPAPAPVAAPAPAPAPLAKASAPAPTSAATAGAAPAADTGPAPLPAGTTVHVEAPPQVLITLKRAEVVQGVSGGNEISVIVEVQNMGYESLKRITFDAWLYDTSGAMPVTVIAPSGTEATPWKGFVRQTLRRGQSAELRLSYGPASRWASDQVIELVKSGRYQIRLKVVSLIDGSDKPLPM
ncbi:MAG: hypothetical protein Q8R72_00735 [Hylemonella sp.]|nr:hypothetical protein [Hylemonella sp.]